MFRLPLSHFGWVELPDAGPLHRTARRRTSSPLYATAVTRMLVVRSWLDF